MTGEVRAVKFIDRSAVNAERESKLLQEINILKELVLYSPTKMPRTTRISSNCTSSTRTPSTTTW